MTQAQLAAEAGCAQPAISEYLKGRVPSGDILVAIARALGTSAESLLGLKVFTRSEVGAWKQRAMNSEQKLDSLKSALQALLKKF